MITANQAKSIIESHFKGSKVRQIYKYSDNYYMLMAPRNNNDASDPIYLVNIANGNYRYLNPLEDIDVFNEAIEKGPIKKF